MNEHPYEDTLLILVSGQARSGTTLLTKAVARHPQVHSNELESNVVRDVLLMVRENLSDPTRRRELTVEPECFALEFRRALYHVLFPVSRIDQRKTAPKALSTFSSLMTECQQFLKVLFPNLLIANIVRNGVEVVASRMVHEHIGKHTFEEHCQAWAYSTRMVDWGHDRDDFFTVRHEATLDRASTQRMFIDLFAAAGLKSSPECSRFVHEKVINTTVVAGETDSHTQDLSTRKHRWKKWSAEQRTMFERLCGPAMGKFGYAIPWKSS